MRALDLYCGGGGAALGMKWAGFDEVVGIDIIPRPNYHGDYFIQADIHHLPINIHDFDFVWASPPCQRFSTSTQCRKKKREKYPDLIPITRDILKGHPYTCIENVPQAPIHSHLVLWGASVGLETIKRKRIFELSFWVFPLPKPDLKMGTYLTITGSMGSNSMFYRRKAQGKPGTITPVEYKHAMGIPICSPMTKKEVAEAVAPPMAKYIAEEAIRQINNK